MVSDLIDRAKTPRGTVNAACEKIAKKLGINYKTVLIIAHGGLAGKALKERIRQLYNNGEITARVRLLCAVDMLTEQDKLKVQQLSMKTRRKILLEAVEGGDVIER